MSLKGAKLIFICVSAPTKKTGHGANKALDLQYIENVIRLIASFYENKEMEEDVIIVEKSTVPVSTSKYIKEILLQNLSKQNKSKFTILSSPEFLAEDKII